MSAGKASLLPVSEVLARASDWFSAEGRSSVASIDAMKATYGDTAVGLPMRFRAEIFFALGVYCETVRHRATREGASYSDKRTAEDLAASLRAAFQPPVGSKSKEATDVA